MPAITTSSQHGTGHLSKDIRYKIEKGKRYKIEKGKIRFYLQIMSIYLATLNIYK